MSSSLAEKTGLMSVSIVAGPATATVLEKIKASNSKRRIDVLDNSKTDCAPTRIIDQIRAIAKKGAVDHLIIECGSETPAMAYASLFLPTGAGASPLTEVARLNATMMAITPAALLGPTCFIAEQVEFVDDIVLEGAASGPDLALARALAATLNPRARLWELEQAKLEEWLDPTDNPFDFAAALDGGGWRQLITGQQPPATSEANIAAFAYRSWKPFHPERFWRLLQNELRGIFRAKGFFWLATRMDLVGGLNLAGRELQCASAGEWWAARNEHAREHEMPERTRNEWREPFGDRRQAIALMGLEIDPTVLKAQLDTCLLTDAEMAAGENSWRNLTDPFPAWSSHAYHHECDHEHASDEHDCCHH
jgi:G3E family GTPase